MKFQNSFWRSSGVLAVLVLESLPLQPLVAAQSPAKHKHAQRPTKQKSVAEPIWDLVITGGMVVTMDRPHRIFDKGIIVAQGDLIVAVEPSTRAAIEQYVHAAKQLIDAKGKLVLPGFINGHTHAAMTLLRGLKDDVTLEEWLTKSIFPAEAKNVNEEFVRWGTRLAAAELIRGGVTTFADMYYFEDAVAEETKAARKMAPRPCSISTNLEFSGQMCSRRIASGSTRRTARSWRNGKSAASTILPAT